MISERQRVAQMKYQQSPKGKAARKRAQKRYERSRKAKARRKKYADSVKGREALAKYKLRR